MLDRKSLYSVNTINSLILVPMEPNKLTLLVWGGIGRMIFFYFFSYYTENNLVNGV